MSDKLSQAALLRKDLVRIIEKMLKTKIMSPNQIQEIEKELVEEMKKVDYNANKVFGLVK
jgi:hypothetical protein